MGTITVRLDADDERLLDRLAQTYGDRSSAVRAALRLLAGSDERQRSLDSFLDDWEREVGAIDQADVDAMARRLGL